MLISCLIPSNYILDRTIPDIAKIYKGAMADAGDELIDYEEDDTGVQLSTVTPSSIAGKDSKEPSDKNIKKGYVGIHSTGFRDFLLKPELLRAIADCGFEHPSEGL